MSISIRKEQPRDAQNIHEVTVAAFLDAPHTDNTEQYIVKALRESGALSISLVAEDKGSIVGHVALSPVTISDSTDSWYGLGPISVLPNKQGKGIGSKLMNAAIQELKNIKAKGCVLTDENGNEYIDAISSWYTCMYGHCNDYIIEKTYQQMQQLDQIMFSDFTHEPAVRLSEELIKILPKGQNKIFFNDNGSTAVEAGIKMALQYYFNKNEKRSTFIAFENGFHGDTFGAMSVSGLSVYNGPFEDFLIDVKRIPTPNGANHQDILEILLLNSVYSKTKYI